MSKIKDLKLTIFIPPFVFLILTTVYSLVANEAFIRTATQIKAWILHNFDWLFSWSTFAFVVILTIIYFSPLAKIKIGGQNATPILTKWRWFAIIIGTTTAVGLLFWGTAEPLYHLHTPPKSLGLEPGSSEAATFALSTLFMHWTLSPYAIYTLGGLLFALVYYNLNQPFSLGALLYPLLGSKAYGTLGNTIDSICLYCLVIGMATSLGTGILMISGGLNRIVDIPSSDVIMGLITLSIVVTFIVSAISGLMKGIRILSDFNTKAFIFLVFLIFIIGPTMVILKDAPAGLADYFYHFVSRSTNINSNIDQSWQQDWTVFYFAVWMAWMPISALFLGRLAVGYTVRQFIHFNLLLPAAFSGLWMLVFSSTSLHMDRIGADNPLYTILQNEGTESVSFAILEGFPLGNLIGIAFIFIAFLAYVTAADSNTSAMSAICTKGINPDKPESPMFIKILWGSIIGIIAWVMVASEGIEGLRILAILGGFPALFLVIFIGIGVLRIVIGLWKSPDDQLNETVVHYLPKIGTI